MGLLGMVAYAISALLLRRLGDRDGTVTIAFWFVTICGIGAGIFSIPNWKPIESGHWPLLLLLGITGTFGQICLTAAFRRASVAVVAPFDYTHMLFAVIYGLAFWGYLPDVRHLARRRDHYRLRAVHYLPGTPDSRSPTAGRSLIPGSSTSTQQCIEAGQRFGIQVTPLTGKFQHRMGQHTIDFDIC